MNQIFQLYVRTDCLIGLKRFSKFLTNQLLKKCNFMVPYFTTWSWCPMAGFLSFLSAFMMIWLLKKSVLFFEWQIRKTCFSCRTGFLGPSILECSTILLHLLYCFYCHLWRRIGCCLNYKLCLCTTLLLHPKPVLPASSSLFCKSVTWRHLWCHLRHLYGAVSTTNYVQNTSASSPTCFAC